MKRFYSDVDVVSDGDDYHISLDGRAAKTRAGASLAARSKRLMAAIAAEWRAQEENIDPDAMPLTRLQSTVIDLGDAQSGAWAERIVSFAESDLLCYRAAEPAALVERQSSLWDPYLEWARATLQVRLVVATGVMHVEQSAASLDALRALLSTFNPAQCLGGRLIAEATGSAVLTLAFLRGGYDADDVFAASRVDETFQIEQWGEDAEAIARAASVKQEFDAAVAFLNLI
ncbi:MAG: ATP12 family protein [Pseudomonadota bacterium]